jgi:hypothetical protein
LPSDLPTPGAFVDPACPINWDHPLNLGLVGDWTIIPNSGWSRGNTLRDLVRGGKNPHDGTLTNGPTWVGGPNGFGAVKHDGSDDATVTASPAISGALTLAALVRLTANGLFTFFVGDSGDFKGLRVPSGTTPSICDGVGDISSSVSIGNNWALVVGTLDGTTARIYVNGAQTGSAASAVTGIGANLAFGARTSGGAQAQACEIGMTAAWNRALSSSDVAALYQESRRGNPERFRWVSTRAGSTPADQPVNTANVWLLRA